MKVSHLFWKSTKMLRLILVASLLVGTYAGVPHVLSPSVNPIKLPQDERIIGGHPTTIENVPYIVAILKNGWHGCGGSIIKADTILTAAHCLELPPSQLSIRAASAQKSSGGQVIPVSSYIIHPGYGTVPNVRWAFDIAVIKLTSPITAAPAMIIQMIDQDLRFPDGSIARTSGWGTIRTGLPSFPEDLHTVLVPTVNHAVCSQAYPGQITPDMLCAGYMGTGGMDACSNDSGGPLAFNNILIGVVSWGRGCALATHPGVYADVGYFRNWIESVI